MIEMPPITGLVLAGGLGRRMGGQDKGLVTYQNKPLIEHVLAAFGPQVSALQISANRNIKRYQQYGYPVWTDDVQHIADFSGPLVGIATGLQHCQTDWLACVPCDAVSLPANLVARLYDAARQHATPLAIVHDGNRTQPLYAVIHRQLLPKLVAYLQADNQKVMAWMDDHQALQVDFSDQQAAFRNINRTEELR